MGCLISDHCFRAAKHDFAVWYRALKQHCQYQCEMCQPEFCVLQSHQGQGCWLASSLPFDQHSDPCASIAWSVWKDMLVAKVAITASAQVWNMPAWGSSWCPHPVTRATGRGQWSSDSAWLLWLTCVAPVILTVQNQRRIIFRTFNVKADGQWPFQTCLGSEVLNQLLFPFTERIFQFFLQKICLNGISKLPTRKPCICLLWFALDARAVLASYIRIWGILRALAASASALPWWHFADKS
jgi:hypothetical protein